MSVFSLKKHHSLPITNFTSPSSFAIMDLFSLQPIPQLRLLRARDVMSILPFKVKMCFNEHCLC